MTTQAKATTVTTHEDFIQAIRALAIARIEDATRRAPLAACKLVYGVGAVAGTRGVTMYGAWSGAAGAEVGEAFVEITAAGEESDIQLAATTIHELGHVLAGFGEGHGKAWKAACLELGLNARLAGGQDYKAEDFDVDLWTAISALPTPADGKPMLRAARGVAIRIPAKPRPCPMGIGTRGGTSRGAGSGSRLRLYVCKCEQPVKVRVASDDFSATCKRCGADFEKAIAPAASTAPAEPLATEAA